jgi:hypothetical protein
MTNFLFLLHCLLWDDYHDDNHDYLAGVVAEFLSIPRQHVIEFKNNANRSFHGSVAIPRSGRNKERTRVLSPLNFVLILHYTSAFLHDFHPAYGYSISNHIFL